MKADLSAAEIEKRFAAINARASETLTDEEAASLAHAEAMDDGTTVDLETLKQELDGFSGRLVIRIPKSLHKLLKQEADLEGVSLNQYMLYKLSR